MMQVLYLSGYWGYSKNWSTNTIQKNQRKIWEVFEGGLVHMLGSTFLYSVAHYPNLPAAYMHVLLSNEESNIFSEWKNVSVKPEPLTVVYWQVLGLKRAHEYFFRQMLLNFTLPFRCMTSDNLDFRRHSSFSSWGFLLHFCRFVSLGSSMVVLNSIMQN